MSGLIRQRDAIVAEAVMELARKGVTLSQSEREVMKFTATVAVARQDREKANA